MCQEWCAGSLCWHAVVLVLLHFSETRQIYGDSIGGRCTALYIIVYARWRKLHSSTLRVYTRLSCVVLYFMVSKQAPLFTRVLLYNIAGEEGSEPDSARFVRARSCARQVRVSQSLSSSLDQCCVVLHIGHVPRTHGHHRHHPIGSRVLMTQFCRCAVYDSAS